MQGGLGCVDMVSNLMITTIKKGKSGKNKGRKEL